MPTPYATELDPEKILPSHPRFISNGQVSIGQLKFSVDDYSDARATLLNDCKKDTTGELVEAIRILAKSSTATNIVISDAVTAPAPVRTPDGIQISLPRDALYSPSGVSNDPVPVTGRSQELDAPVSNQRRDLTASAATVQPATSTSLGPGETAAVDDARATDQPVAIDTEALMQGALSLVDPETAEKVVRGTLDPKTDIVEMQQIKVAVGIIEAVVAEVGPAVYAECLAGNETAQTRVNAAIQNVLTKAQGQAQEKHAGKTGSAPLGDGETAAVDDARTMDQPVAIDEKAILQGALSLVDPETAEKVVRGTLDPKTDIVAMKQIEVAVGIIEAVVAEVGPAVYAECLAGNETAQTQVNAAIQNVLTEAQGQAQEKHSGKTGSAPPQASSISQSAQPVDDIGSVDVEQTLPPVDVGYDSGYSSGPEKTVSRVPRQSSQTDERREESGDGVRSERGRRVDASSHSTEPLSQLAQTLVALAQAKQRSSVSAGRGG